MTTLFAPPEVLSAFSYAVAGSDPDLQKGTHLRVFACMGASFPLAPLAVFKIRTVASEPQALHVTDAKGNVVERINLAQFGTADVIPLLGDTGVQRVVRLELVPSPPGGVTDAQLLDQHGRLVAERTDGRFLFSAPALSLLRLSGSAPGVIVLTRTARTTDFVTGQFAPDTMQLLGLPISGSHPWYFGVQDRKSALERVSNGAPLRLNVMDRPEGPFDPLTADDETARVEAMLAAANPGGLESLLLKMVDDRTAPPWAQIESQEMNPADGGTKQFADVPRLGNLLMASLDPGLGRFLGFADCIHDLPDLTLDRGWDALAVAGLFAFDTKVFDPTGTLGTLDPLGAWMVPDPNEPLLLEMVLQGLSLGAGRDVRVDVAQVVANARRQGLTVRAMLTVTAPTPPWLAPALPAPALLQDRWQTADGDTPSALYRTTFAFDRAPLAAMAAVSANIEGNQISRHGTVSVDGRPIPVRATPRLFGHEQETSARFRALLPMVTSSLPHGLLADQNLPADAGPIAFRFAASDFFGRFGVAATLQVTPPPRPVPPPPVLRSFIERDVVDPLSMAAISPGTLHLVFAVPQPSPAPRFSNDDQPRLASAVAVPAVSEMAAGSKSIQIVNLTLDAQALTVDVSTPGFFEASFPLPDLLPQETRNVNLTAAFTNVDGATSLLASQVVKITDMRPPQVVETGLGLFWSSAPGPCPEVELKLSWPGAPDSLYRVYATDQQGLALTPADLAEAGASITPSRGRVAEAGCRKVLGGAPIQREVFHLVTDPALKAGADGRAVLRTTLPRSLQTVQFFRVVPLSAEGAEAPFDQCGIVPVAVPDSRRNAAPRLDGSADPATGVATLIVSTDAFDGVSLQRDEPGLFDGGAVGNTAPDFRIRRAVGPVIDPIYGRVVLTGTLASDAGALPAVRFVGTGTDDNKGPGLEAFVKYIYWAEVRLPPERRLPAGVVPLDPPGGVTSVEPENAADHPRLWSLPSAPRVVLHAPATNPAPPVPAAVSFTRSLPDAEGNVTLAITIIAPPTAHPKAVDQYRLAVWSRWPDQPITAITIANGAALNDTWPPMPNGFISIQVTAPLVVAPPVDPTGTLDLFMAFVDPLGRMSDLAPFTLPA